MHPDIRHEEVIYQNPFLCVRIWQIDSPGLPESEIHRRRETLFGQDGAMPHWHYHEEIEFILIREGGMTVLLAEEQFEMGQGDVALFGSSEPHTTVQSLPGKLSYIVFQLDLAKHLDQSTVSTIRYFSEVLRPLSKLNYIFREQCAVRNRVAGMIGAICREMERKTIGYELAVSAMIKKIFLLLLRHDTRKVLHCTDDPLLDRISPALHYIDENLSGRLLIEDVTKQVNLSYYYFIKVFKKAVGMTFTHYINFKRIKRAEQLLLTGDGSISEVAESVGIPNLGHFYDMFRRFNGCSPKQFRLKLTEASRGRQR